MNALIVLAFLVANARLAQPLLDAASVCGDPSLESMAWQLVPAELISVSGNQRVRVGIGETNTPVDVTLAGIRVSKQKLQQVVARFGRRAKVVLVVNPADWKTDRLGNPPKQVTARILLSPDQGGDLGMLLLLDKEARFHSPPAYKMSRHLECEYRNTASTR